MYNALLMPLPSKLDELLARSSSLTPTQVNTATLWRKALDGHSSAKEAARQREGGPVTLGSYHRSLNQARMNSRTSVFTILLGVRLGWIKPDALIRLVELVAKVPSALDDETSNEVISLLDALSTRIVML